jgi:hypothetical protein
MAKAKTKKKPLVQIKPSQQALLRKLPGVDHLMALTAKEAFFKDIPPAVVSNASPFSTMRRPSMIKAYRIPI